MRKAAKTLKIEPMSAQKKQPFHMLRPLSAHLGLAMAEYQLAGQGGTVQSQQMQDMLRGIKKYQNHPYHRPAPRYEVIWQAGEARVLRHKTPKAAPGDGPTILLVPSLINRSAILDLLPHFSFMRFLEKSGHDVVLLDWGEPLQDPAMTTMDMLVGDRLIPAITHIAEQSGHPVNLLGYCMGGTLIAAAVTLSPDPIEKLVFMASPWDFHAGDPKMRNSVAAGTLSAFEVMSRKDHLPMNWIQSVFAAVNADRAADKFASFAAIINDTPRENLFVAVEDWLNDGVDLPAAIAKTCITEWYGENRPMRGTWQVCGQTIDPVNIPQRALIIASDRDRLVPAASALALAKILRHADTLAPPSGHVGMMTGKNAKQAVWAPVSDWLHAI